MANARTKLREEETQQESRFREQKTLLLTQEALLTERQAGEFFGYKDGQVLAALRLDGEGPVYYHFRGRIRYRFRDLVKWREQQLVSSR